MIFNGTNQEHRAKKTILTDIAKAEKVAEGAESSLGQIASALDKLKGAMALGDEKASQDARTKLVDQQSEELKREASQDLLIDLRTELQAREQYDAYQARLSDHQHAIDEAKIALAEWKKKKPEATRAMEFLNEISNRIEIYKFSGDPVEEYTIDQHRHGNASKIRNFHPCSDRLSNLADALDREINRLTEISNSTPEQLENQNHA